MRQLDRLGLLARTLRLLRQRWPGAVVLDGDEKDGQIVGAGRSNMLFRVCHARAAVCKEHSEPIAWND